MHCDQTNALQQKRIFFTVKNRIFININRSEIIARLQVQLARFHVRSATFLVNRHRKFKSVNRFFQRAFCLVRKAQIEPSAPIVSVSVNQLVVQCDTFIKFLGIFRRPKHFFVPLSIGRVGEQSAAGRLKHVFETPQIAENLGFHQIDFRTLRP